LLNWRGETACWVVQQLIEWILNDHRQPRTHVLDPLQTLAAHLQPSSRQTSGMRCETWLFPGGRVTDVVGTVTTSTGSRFRALRNRSGAFSLTWVT